ncbi:MAG: carboxypeptidase regulatory-like domain-containing protein [Deltaproteobacteria bacterium]|nr:carboxypeptidase regulatory-like domain-containing protein [Deltaproteobacteria bacterium]
MAKYGMVIDIRKCNGCYNCFLACRDEHCGNDYPPYAAAQPAGGQFWMRLIEKERGKYPKVKVAYTALPCMQCENAPCIEASSNNAVYARPDGIVIIDPEKAKGQKDIVSSCPYRVINWNEDQNLPQKCTFCAHLLDKGWKEPRCVEACPTRAIIFGDLEDPDSEISKIMASENVESLHPEYGLKPRVQYIGLPKRFIAGTVAFDDNEDEWAGNVTVTLTGNGEGQTIETDAFGDFEFEGLQPETEYAVKIEYDGYAPREFQVRTRTDVYLGEVVLSPGN